MLLSVVSAWLATVCTRCQPTAPANSEVVPTPRMVEEPDFSGAEVLDAEVNEPVEGGETESQEPEEVASVDAIAEKEVHVDAGPPFSAGETEVENEGIKEVEDEENAAVDVDGEAGEQHEAGTEEEDIYQWIEDVRKRGLYDCKLMSKGFVVCMS